MQRNVANRLNALGIPFISSSSLRGVARNDATKKFMNEGMTWTEAVAPCRGFVENLKGQGAIQIFPLQGGKK